MRIKDIESLPEQEFQDKYLKAIFKELSKTKFPSKPCSFVMHFNADFEGCNLTLKKEISVNG